jgi:Glycosyltransferase sugar-binding region containing DXD motif
MQSANRDVHMFWAYGDLSNLERLCISSFITKGYIVNLWTYGKISNAPAGVLLKDANKFIPESRIFLNKSNSYVSFSDLFRYKVLNEVGGLYADTDVIALVSPDYFTEPLLVTESQPENQVTINNNIIYNPHPTKGNLIDLAYAVADRFPPDKITWDEIGPKLLTSFIFLQPDHGFQIKAPIFANPFLYWKCPGALLTPGIEMPPDVGFVHCYSSWWGRTGTSKDMNYPAGSLMSKFENEFGSGL